MALRGADFRILVLMNFLGRVSRERRLLRLVLRELRRYNVLVLSDCRRVKERRNWSIIFFMRILCGRS
jgi:hypothetical protein